MLAGSEVGSTVGRRAGAYVRTLVGTGVGTAVGELVATGALALVTAGIGIAPRSAAVDNVGA